MLREIEGAAEVGERAAITTYLLASHYDPHRKEERGEAISIWSQSRRLSVERRTHECAPTKKCLWRAGVSCGKGRMLTGRGRGWKTLLDLLSDPWVMGTLETPLPVGDSAGRRVVNVRRRHGKHFSPPRPQECASLRDDSSLPLTLLCQSQSASLIPPQRDPPLGRLS